MNTQITRLFSTLVLFTTTLHAGEQPHQHGVASLQVVVEGNTLVVHLESPLDNLVGFERTPKTDAERSKIQRSTQRLRHPAELLQPTSEAGCSVDKITLASDVLDPALLGESAVWRTLAHQDKNHAELSTTWRFVCTKPDLLRGLEVKLFDAFPGLKRLQTQVAGPRGQSRATLTHSKRKLSW